MRLIATCMASNEADVIEAFVRHNLRFLDAIVVLDHGSVDSTPAILAALAQEGLPVVALSDRDRAFRQGQRQTQLAHRFMRELGADFCFALDADEFIKCRSRDALEASLAALPAGAFGLVLWQNYIPDAASNDDANVLRRITSRETGRVRPERKVVLNRRFLEGGHWQVAIGNHFAITVVDGQGTVSEHAQLADAWLAHFPIRSGAQLTRKVILGWLAQRLADPGRNMRSTAPGMPSPAWHWSELYREVMNGERFEGERLRAAALKYYAEEIPPGAPARPLVHDPLPVAFELRHTPPVEMSPLVALARWTDGLVSSLIEPDPSRTPPPA